MLILGGIFLISCENTIVKDNTSNEKFQISLQPSFEISTETSPLTKSNSEDLYGVMVVCNNQRYAKGIFDDPGKMTIELEQAEYDFLITDVKDWKDKIFNINGFVGSPFMGNITNAFDYSNDGLTLDDNYSYYNQIKQTSDWYAGGGNEYAPVLRYYGELDNYTPQSNERITLNLKCMSFGMKIIATNITKGNAQITVFSDNVTTYDGRRIFFDEKNITSDFSSEERIFEFANIKECYRNIENDYSEELSVSVKWENGSESKELTPQNIHVKRNMMNTINIDFGAITKNNDMHIIEEPFGKENDIFLSFE